MRRREEPIPALSAGLSYVVMTGLMLTVAIPQRPRQIDFIAPVPPVSAPHPSAGATPAPAGSSPSSPVGPTPAADTAEPEVKEEWPQEDIARGREQCMHVLSSVSAEVEWLEPIKKGPCVLPAPVRLKSIGYDSNKVVFEPAVDVNCRMVAALGKWVKTTLQPKARERLKSQVVRIVGASGYSCRNIYNLPNARLSQHALANAIDIGGFALADGRTVRVLKGWGLTARDIKAQKAKAEAAKKAGKSKLAAAQGEGSAPGAAAPTTSKAGKLEKSGRQVTQASMKPPIGLTLEKKSALTGLPSAKAGEPAKPTNEALFLRAVHGGACGDFGTVMGPEANDPHRNHFHLDLIPRRGAGYCE